MKRAPEYLLAGLSLLCLAARADAPPVPSMATVPAGAFTMGRPDTGFDEVGGDDELPRHEVFLAAYEIGLHEVSNAQLAAVYNWAIDTGRLMLDNANPARVQLNGQLLLDLATRESALRVEGGRLRVDTEITPHAATLPATFVTWYGAAAFCNWQGEWEGRPPCYDLAAWSCIAPDSGGYRLPTEAEWERAAAWRPETRAHGPFAFTMPPGRDAMNFYDTDHAIYVNPLQSGMMPFLSPVAWFTEARSPVGCFDMSGNVWEWCNDWYHASYYADSPRDNPAGPVSGAHRVERGGSWRSPAAHCRTAKRNHDSPGLALGDLGFRVARAVRPTAASPDTASTALPPE